MSNVLGIGALLSILELMLLYFMSPKKIELTTIDGYLTAVVYSNYFFLPFTTKIRKYKDIKKAYISSRRKRSKAGYYTVYDLILKYSKKSVVLFGEYSREKDLLEYCDKINKFILSHEDCVINDSKTKKGKIITLCVSIFVPSIIFIAALAGKTNPKDMEYLIFLHGYAIAVVIVLVFVLLSLTVNRYISSSDEKKVISQIGKINESKKNIDINSEAKRIYDSIIK